MKTIELNMTIKKTTKGTYVYEEVKQGERPLTIPSVYIRRTAFEGTPPTDIVVTVGVPS